ncbi:hypothetical protein MTBBW1_300116 [Desulfamplus magnetovallimortis]|uniref:Uncharacterized protein n=1 Tax=Desulfamplus magnetovallimortis TaxID=1246637 RepID=A0A1W1HG62_9BACT|nr:hypothetical protein MTBBW1_300116 [Desulfamplus magnetovallimortis]
MAIELDHEGLGVIDKYYSYEHL